MASSRPRCLVAHLQQQLSHEALILLAEEQVLNRLLALAEPGALQRKGAGHRRVSLGKPSKALDRALHCEVELCKDMDLGLRKYVERKGGAGVEEGSGKCAPMHAIDAGFRHTRRPRALGLLGTPATAMCPNSTLLTPTRMCLMYMLGLPCPLPACGCSFPVAGCPPRPAGAYPLNA